MKKENLIKELEKVSDKLELRMNYMEVGPEEYYFLAFHKEEQRDDFLKNNRKLVLNYLMIDHEKSI